MRSEFKDGKLYLRRTEEERTPLLHRLLRIEGQVRGLQQMIQQDRDRGEEIQQMQAILSATREVMRLLVAQHVSVGIGRVLEGATQTDAAMADIDRILQTIIRNQ